MASDFKNLKDSGRACVGCGRNSNEVMLMRLRNYSRSLCCGACFIKYATCENENPAGIKCHHEPQDHLRKIGPCSMAGCGCTHWIHGLESEFDRQFADSVGKIQQSKQCSGLGGNPCFNLIFIQADGTISRLCPSCEKIWVMENRELYQQVKKLLNIDPAKEIPQ